jgi:predicted  nucleic acid-binding Zn-ribbon protein
MRVQIFVQLQAIDQQLQAYASGRDSLLTEFKEHDALRLLREQRRKMVSQLKHERERSSDLQWELADLERRLSTLEEQEQEGPSDPLVARELVVLRESRLRLEEQVLQQLERIAELQAQCNDLDREYTERAQAWSIREPDLQMQLDQLQHEIEVLQTRRQALAQQLPTGEIQIYDDLQRRHRGTAFARIRNRQCSICYARLPSAVFDMLANLDTLVRCPRCGRVLYLEEDLNSSSK